MKMMPPKYFFFILGLTAVQSCGDAGTESETEAMSSSQKAALSAFLQNSEQDPDSADQAPENKVVVCEQGEGWASFRFQEDAAASGRSKEKACVTFTCQFLPEGWRYLVKKSPTLEGEASTEAKAKSGKHTEAESNSRAGAKADLSELFITLDSLHKKGHWLCAKGESPQGEAQPPEQEDDETNDSESDNPSSTEGDEPTSDENTEQEEDSSGDPEQGSSAFSISVSAEGQLIVQ